MTHWYVWHDSLICVTWLIDMCDMTHWYVWHDSLICVPWLIDMCDMTLWYVRHDSLICATWLFHTCMMIRLGTTPLRFRRLHILDSFTCATWLYYTYAITHPYVQHDSFIFKWWLILARFRSDLVACTYMTHSDVRNEPIVRTLWLIYVCDMTHSHVRDDTFRHDAALTSSPAHTRLIQMCDVTPSYVCYGVATISRLLKIIGLFCRILTLLQTRPISLRSLLIVATPYDAHSGTMPLRPRRLHTRVMCDMTRWRVCNGAFLCAAWLIHVWHDSFLCATWLIYMRDMTHLSVRHYSSRHDAAAWPTNTRCVWHDSSLCATWLIHMCDMTHSYVRHDSLIYVTWLIHMCAMPHSYVHHDVFSHGRCDLVACTRKMCVPWLIHMCDTKRSIHRCDMTHSYVPWHIHMCNITHSYVRHDTFICDITHSYVRHDTLIYVTWLIHMCDMTHSYVRHDTFICATWHIHTCNMTHSYVQHDTFICATWHINICDMTHSYVRHDTFICPPFICAMTHSYVPWPIHTCHDPSNVTWPSHTCAIPHS